MTTYLAQTPPPSPAPAAGSAAREQSPLMTFLPLVLMGLAFYFMLIRPQSKRAKETAAKQSALKRGDEVATSGGIIGKVVSLDEKTVTLQVSEGVRIPFQRSHVTEFFGEPAKAEAEKA